MLSNSIYLFLSKVFGYGIRILLPVFLVRILSKEDFGAYNQFFLLEILIQSLFQMGIIQSLFYFVPRDKKNAGGYLLNSLLLNVLIYSLAYAVVWVFRDQVAHELGMAIITRYFWYMAIYSMLMMLNVALVSYFSARNEIIEASVLTVLREIIASIATLLAAFKFRSLDSIFLALIIARGLTLVVGMAYVHFKIHGFRSERYFFGIGEQIRYGLVLGLGGAIGTLALKFHEMTVTRNYDLETYAVYAAGLKQIPILQFFGQSISAVALSQFALLVKKDDWDGVRKLWDKVQGTMYGVGLPIAIILLAVSKPLVHLMFTSEYADAVSIFRINTLGTLALILNSTLVLRAMDRNDVTLKINVIMLILLPPALYGGMKLGGLDGIIAAHTVILLASKAAAQAYLNRLAPVYLPYVAPWRSIGDFYIRSWARGLEILAKVRGRKS